MLYCFTGINSNNFTTSAALAEVYAVQSVIPVETRTFCIHPKYTSAVYHDKCPSLVDHLALGQRRTVVVEHPEQRNHSRVGVNLAVQVHVRVAHVTRSRRAHYLRTVCKTRFILLILFLRVPPYLRLHPLTQNDQIRHGNTYGRGVFLGGQPRRCICTNASRGLSATAEFLVIVCCSVTAVGP